MNPKLRLLEEKDAPLMLEWMHDDEITQWLEKDFATKNIEDCQSFIRNSWSQTDSFNFAIVDDKDNYQGTVSLKNISKKCFNAEFAIVIRREAMAKGYSTYAINEIIRRGLDADEINEVYWCVSPKNKRAIRFYDKNGFQRISFDELSIDTIISQSSSWYRDEQIAEFYWYHVIR